MNDGAESIPGTTIVDPDPAETARIKLLIKAKYGFEFHGITLFERIIARGSKDRVAVRITV